MSQSSSSNYTLDELPPLIIGGAVCNTIYSKDPSKLPLADIFREAFSKGNTALDTSPYYGKSEELMGAALDSIKEEWPREKYFIFTKAGRIQEDEFDYSRQHVRKSVLRSLQRLKTTYLDAVYMHDVEFVTADEAFEALRELVQLKKEGIIKYIGISGYPVEYLYKLAYECSTTHSNEIGALDVILSYSHGCLQNNKLFDIYEDFLTKAHVKKLMNGSILSMSLLRSGPTHDFHPASKELRDAVQDSADKLLKEDNVELAELATRYAIKKWLFLPGEKDSEGKLKINPKVSTVLGVSSIAELESALKGFEDVRSDLDNGDEALFEKFQFLLGSHFNETWPSGIEH
ncbi:hypothetical protein PUMCH_000534 [Australozyma saopauloensis]|uniref:NADP-dependent oxidoreductase domain-containing protein n=1 Tax=Australozyma saopauloensis TaxID=291208 RepID=A0AAX4H457_9ASCO|nr:hypothetical protein PUMCH_000534 [[Candida] saopauloensis]